MSIKNNNKLNNLKKPSCIPKILQILEQEYPLATTALHYSTPFQLLLAVILSAQTTDKQVNKTTKKLFRKITRPHHVLEMEISCLEKEIQGCGLFRQKSRQIMATSRLLCDKFNGEIPRTREELMILPGVGRKTANVILSTAFGLPALAVDTHVQRISQRLGLSRGKNALAVEKELCRLIPRELWQETHHRLIAHGRQVCRARKPLCNSCSLNSYCPSRNCSRENKAAKAESAAPKK